MSAHRAVIALVAWSACGPARPASPLAGMAVSMSTVEWRAKASDDPGKVDVTLVVDGQKHALGAVDGTVETCAIRKAEATATELVCGTSTLLAAELRADDELGHVLAVGDGTRQLVVIPIGPSVAISVAPYAMPVAP
jgi:hypothetical protein